MKWAVSELFSKSGVRIKRPCSIVGYLDVSKETAMLLDGNALDLLSRLQRARLETIPADGVRLSGVQEDACGRWHYQEWFCRPRPEGGAK